MPFGGRFQVYFHSKFTIYKVPLKTEYSLGLEGGCRGEGRWDWGFGKDKKASSTRMQGFITIKVWILFILVGRISALALSNKCIPCLSFQTPEELRVLYGLMAIQRVCRGKDKEITVGVKPPLADKTECWHDCRRRGVRSVLWSP